MNLLKTTFGKVLILSVVVTATFLLYGCRSPNVKGHRVASPMIELFCPTYVAENEDFSCTVDATSKENAAELSCSVDESTTCANVSLIDCQTVNVSAQGAPGSCDVAINVVDNRRPKDVVTGVFTLLITEVQTNSNPTVDVACPSNVAEDTATSCALTATDTDLPPQNLTCTLNPISTCAGATITDCRTVDVPAQGEASPLTCSIEVDIVDDYISPGYGIGSDDIFIDEVNQNPVITLDCPANVKEDTATACAIAASDGDLPAQTLTCSVNAATTCTGVTVTDCSTANIPAQGENAPADCSVVVDVQDDFSTPGTAQGNDTITIDEVNQNPTITVNCPASADENAATTCPLTVADSDLPAQTLTCSVNAATSCTGVTLTGCTQANVPAQGEGAPPSCSVVVDVQDDFSTPGTAIGSDSITINELNQNPTITVNCPANVKEDTATVCAISASDGDLPAQTLTCAVDVSTTCTGVTLTGCSAANVPAQGENAPADCSVVVNVQDDFGTPGTAQGNDTITIDEVNQNPTITVNCPASADENAATTCPLTVADTDLPAQTLTCSVNAATTCTGVTLTGCTQANVPAQGESAPVSCSVVVNVQDDFIPVGTAVGSDSMTINEVNQNPAITVDCPTNMKEDSGATCILTASDADQPPQTLTCSVDASSTCTGVTLTGCNTANVPAQGESAPATCSVVVNVQDNFGPPGTGQGNDTITIDEINENPSITLTCPPDMDENKGVTCTVSVADTDVPAQNLTCSLSTNTSCEGVTVNGCTSVSVPAQGEEAPNSCNVVVEVQDDFAPPGSSQDSAHIVINQLNSNPTVKVFCPESVGEDSATECAIAASDPDWPPQRLTCDINLSLTTCADLDLDTDACDVVYVGPQGEKAGPGNCVVAIEVYDGLGGTANGSDTLKITEVNRPPYWVNPPADIVVQYDTDYASSIIIAGDDDWPDSNFGDPGYLKCSKTTTSCPFWPFVSGDGAGSVNCEVVFTSPNFPYTCELTVKVTDGIGASIEKTIKVITTDIWYLDAAIPVSGDGTSWATAFKHIEEAMGAAGFGDAVFVADGDYWMEPGNEAVLYLGSGVMWFGGFEGGWEESTSDRAQPVSNNTASVLDAASGNNCHAVVGYHIYDAVLDGFRLTGGVADSAYCNYYGGGGIINDRVYNTQFNNLVIYNNVAYNDTPNGPPFSPYIDWEGGGGGIKNIYSFNVSLKNNVLYKNYAGGNPYAGGGAIFNIMSDTYIYNNILHHNKAGGMGGGVLNQFTNQVISSSYFGYNYSYSYGGGAIANIDSVFPYGPGYYFQTRISDSVFYENKSYWGGAILNYYGALDISNSDIVHNHAYYYDMYDNGSGGGVANFHTPYGSPFYLSIKDSYIAYNEARSGGGISNYYGQNFISNCIISVNDADVSGGGIYNYDSHVQISNSEISDNKAGSLSAGKGGGMYNEYSYVTLNNSTVKENSSYYDGGGMFNYASSVYADNSQINDNTAGDDGGGVFNAYHTKLFLNNSSLSGNNANYNGGGIYAGYESPASISNSILSDNSSGNNGGAIYASQAYGVAIYDSTISDNYAAYNGGGVHATDYTQLKIYDSIISNNYSYSDNNIGGGGVAVTNDADAYIGYSVFQNNQAYYSGGAIALDNYGYAAITNNLFFGNRAGYYWGDGYGGAIDVVNYSNAYITNCTFSGNKAEYGGAIRAYDYGYASISNSILWGDVASGGNPEIYVANHSNVDIGYSDLTNYYTGSGNIGNDPLFVNVPRMWDYTANIAGFNDTITVNDASLYFVNEVIEINMDGVARVVTDVDTIGDIVTFAPSLISPALAGVLVQDWGAAPISLVEDFYMRTGSPVIDTGTATGAPPEDFVHNPRPVNVRFDMGAYEYQGP